LTNVDQSRKLYDRKYYEKRKEKLNQPMTSTEYSAISRSVDENRKKHNLSEKERNREKRQDSKRNFPIETDEFYKPDKTKKATWMARYRDKKKYLERPNKNWDDNDIFDVECRPGFDEKILIELASTRFENKAIQCCNWMTAELNRGEIKMKSLVSELVKREIVAKRARKPFIPNELEERILEEGTYLYSNLYGSYGLCLCLLDALEKWGMRSSSVCKLVLELLLYMYKAKMKIDIVSELLHSDCLKILDNIIKFWSFSKIDPSNSNVEYILRVSEVLRNRVLIHKSLQNKWFSRLRFLKHSLSIHHFKSLKS